MRKQRMCVVLALALCWGLTAPALAAAPAFTDVPASYWAYDAIERAYAGGIVNGTSYDQATGARTYSPENSLTLAHFVVMLTRAFYGAEVERSSATSAWYAKNLAAAKAHGLLDGLGAYSMDATATRYQMASIMAAIMEDKGAAMPSGAELAKAQGQIGDWADIPQQYQDAVAAVFALGIIQGTDSKGTFAGEATVKRSHAAVIYGRLADAIEALSGTEQGQTPAKEYTMSLGVMHREIEVGDYTNAQCLFEPYHDDITIKFTSSNTSVATVEAYCTDGAHVYGKGPGTAVITATAPNGETDSVTVTVVGGTAKEYTMSLGVMHREIKVGDYTNAQCLFKPYHNDITVKFTSSNTSVATVEAYCTDGAHVYAKSPGTAVITATAPNGEKDSVTVTVVSSVVEEELPDSGNVIITAPDIQDSSSNDFVDEVVRLVNVERAKEGLPALTTMTDLTAAAQLRAEELPKAFAHERPDGRNCFTVLNEGGIRYAAAGENIAAGQATPESVVASWMDSPGHRANILGKHFTAIGVGHTKVAGGYHHYWTQLFIST